MSWLGFVYNVDNEVAWLFFFSIIFSSIHGNNMGQISSVWLDDSLPSKQWHQS